MVYSSYHRNESRLSQINWLIVLLVCVLALFGIAMLYSAANGEWSPWANRQALRFLIGFVLMIGLAVIPSHLLLRHAYTFYFLCLGLLLLVEFIGHMGMGAQRWLSLGVFTLQPSEIMKLALILALARYYHGLLPEDVSRPLMMMPSTSPSGRRMTRWTLPTWSSPEMTCAPGRISRRESRAGVRRSATDRCLFYTLESQRT